MIVCIKFNVIGHVQGVGYRYFAYRQALRLGVNGYAKNLYDGTVEVIAQGKKENVNELYDYLLQGPSRSNVTKVTREDIITEKQYKEFSIR
jgi:acylphosphatase